jgi:hypothetical protein
MSRLFRVLAACATASLLACGQQPAAESNIDDIIGGVDGSAKSLNAIGTLGVKDASGNYQFFCSASLIGPSTVLTAKHCTIVLQGPLAGMKLVNLIPIYFALGSDAMHPTKVVEAIAADTSTVEYGGFVGLGNDVGVYELMQPITEVAPLKVAAAPLQQADMGKKFVSIGFGAQSVYEDLTGNLKGTRMLGAETARALQGKAFELMLGSFQALYDQLVYEFGKDVVDANIDLVHQWYDQTTILGGYEGWFGHVAGDVQTCHGDSGGPLLHKMAADGSLGSGKGTTVAIWGVVSGGWHSRNLTCDYGTFYAAIGPKTMDLIKSGLAYSDPCGGAKYSTLGACEGTVAKRCTGKWEGDRRLSVVDCSDLGLTCKTDTAGQVGCWEENANPSHTPPVQAAPPPTLAAIKHQVAQASQGLNRVVGQKLQGH